MVPTAWFRTGLTNQSRQVGHTHAEAVDFPIRGTRAFNGCFNLRPDPIFSLKRWPMSTALALSLLIHALLLSLDFGNQEFGLPGFSLPWRERRFEAGDLRVALVPAQVATPALIEPSANLKPTGMAKSEPVAALPHAPAPVLIASERSDMAALVASVTPVVAAPVMAAAPSTTSPAAGRPTARDESEAAQIQIDPVVRERDLELAKLKLSKQQVQQLADQMEAVRESATRQQDERQEAARQQAERQEAARQEAARQAAVRQEAERAETARVDAEREDAARQAVARNEAAQVEVERLETARQAAVRQEAERAEAARLDANRQDTARQAVARNEAVQVEVERLEAARLDAERKAAAQLEVERKEAARLAAVLHEAERQEAARQAVTRNEAAQVEVERQEAARQAAARQEAERAEATRVEAERQETAGQERERQKAARAEQEAKREAVLRAIGRQLDAEAAKRDAASSSTARRGRLFGRTDPNTELILYAEAWSRKIELNMTFDMVREAAKQRHTNPLVTVAVRSDGSVESVTFVVSSGVAELDEAVRRIVQSQAPYRAFPPGLSRDYDVIEMRRSWYFDMAVRLF